MINDICHGFIVFDFPVENRQGDVHQSLARETVIVKPGTDGTDLVVPLALGPHRIDPFATATPQTHLDIVPIVFKAHTTDS
jgi:hypothetical protein